MPDVDVQLAIRGRQFFRVLPRAIVQQSGTATFAVTGSLTVFV